MTLPGVVHETEPFFLEGSTGPLYACLHAPVGPSVGRAWVVAPPYGHESLQFHRALRLLADLLADAGCPVLRFDYHGTGDSSGDARGALLDRWFTDTAEMIDELRRRTGVADVGLIGLRLGGAVATRVAAARPDVVRLVLWDPVFDGRAHLAELRALHETMLGYAHVIPDATGSRDEVLGYPLTPALAADIEGIDVVRNITSRPADHVLLVETHEGVPQEPLRRHLGSFRCQLANARLSTPQLWEWVEDFGRVHVPRKVLDAIVRWAGEGASRGLAPGSVPGA